MSGRTGKRTNRQRQAVWNTSERALPRHRADYVGISGIVPRGQHFSHDPGKPNAQPHVSTTEHTRGAQRRREPVCPEEPVGMPCPEMSGRKEGEGEQG